MFSDKGKENKELMTNIQWRIQDSSEGGASGQTRYEKWGWGVGCGSLQVQYEKWGSATLYLRYR